MDLIDKNISKERKHFRSELIARFWMILFLLLVLGPIVLVFWLAAFER